MLVLWYDNKQYGHCHSEMPYFEIFIPPHNETVSAENSNKSVGLEIFEMSTISIVFGSILLACALFLIVAVLLQDSQKGLSGAIAGGSDTYYGKNKGKSKQKKLSKLTAIASIVFVVIALATFVVGK